MVDSDDDYEKRGRDKFRQERSDYDRDDRRGGRDQNRSNWSKNSRDRRDDRNHRRSPIRNDSSPQAKKVKRDWEDSYPQYDVPYGPRLHGPPHPMWTHPSTMVGSDMHSNVISKGSEVDYPTQPPMMTFKHFLATQDDNITDDESIRKYNEYKLEFKRQQIKEFFVQHKDEEWFRSKYHPDEYEKRQEEIKSSLFKRCNVFETLLKLGWLEDLKLDMSSSEKLIRVMDAAVILMEGGTEDDLNVLDLKEDETTTSAVTSNTTNTKSTSSTANKNTTNATDSNVDDTGNNKVVNNGENTNLNQSVSAESNKNEKTNENIENNSEKEKESDEGKGDVEGDKKGEGLQNQQEENKDENKEKEKNKESENQQRKEEETETKLPSQPKPLHKTQSIFLRNLIPSITKQEVDAMCKRYPGFMRVCIQDPQPERKFARRGWITFDRTVNVKDICWNLNNIRLRDCDMGAIVNRELRQRVRPVNGLTVDKQVARQDIKHAAKIIQNLDSKWLLWKKNKNNNSCANQSINNGGTVDGGVEAGKGNDEANQLGDNNTSCTSNNSIDMTNNNEDSSNVTNNNGNSQSASTTDTTTTITTTATTTITTISSSSLSTSSSNQGPPPSPSPSGAKEGGDEGKGEGDVKNVTNVYEEQKDLEQNLGFISNNPVLRNITDFLVDEADYEDELLGPDTSKEKEISQDITIERDEQLFNVLDLMLIYLRLVYSVDFYGTFEYPNEDEMPHRCGILHARGLNTLSNITHNDVKEWMSNFEAKIQPLLNPKFKIDEAEAIKLGKKNVEEEVEKFISSNTQELGKEKWLCPLSGKKFKGAEFVRKHILTKHAEKVQEVKDEVIYFNNYLNDPRRVQLPEHPSSKPPTTTSSSSNSSSIMPPLLHTFTPFYRPPVYHGMYSFNMRGPDSYRREVPGVMIHRRDKGRSDPRSMVSYTDLDAPPEID